MENHTARAITTNQQQQQEQHLQAHASPTSGPHTPANDVRVTHAAVPAKLQGLAKKPNAAYGFLLIFFATIFIIYSMYVSAVLLPELALPGRLKMSSIIGIVFHVSFALFLIADLQAIGTEPGKVPENWAFDVGDGQRRKRYCRVCNCWKPSRTHHCSQCQRCVLNMDHHCPWINNCVGFYNRKFFLQTLLYANLSLFIIEIHTIFHVLSCANHLLPVYNAYGSVDAEAVVFPHTETMELVEGAVALALLAIVSLLIAGVCPFTRFHWQLLIINSTTIESIDPAFRDQAMYDLGTKRNIEQVFGPYPLLWFVPWHMSASRPVGDGVRWRRHYLRVPMTTYAPKHHTPDHSGGDYRPLPQDV